MSQKVITSFMAVVAFAVFALPATAFAANNPQLMSSGTVVPAGTSIVGTAMNTEFTSTAGGNLVTCSSAKLMGTVKKNSGGTVEGELSNESASFEGTGAVSSDNGLPECTATFGNAFITVTTALCVKADSTMAEDEFQVTGAACGSTGKAKFIIGSTTAGECEYESTGNIKGTYTTGGTEAKLSTIDTSEGSGSKLIKGGFLCPTSGALKMTFTLETVNPPTKLTIS